MGFRGWDEANPYNGGNTALGNIVVAEGGKAPITANRATALEGEGGGDYSFISSTVIRIKGESGRRGSETKLITNVIDAIGGIGGGVDGGTTDSKDGQLGGGGAGGNIDVATGQPQQGGDGGDGFIYIFALGPEN